MIRLHTNILPVLLIALVMALSFPRMAIADKNELLIGLIPEENIFKQVRRHKPLAEYLSKHVGIKVRFTVLSRYPHIVTRFQKRGLDGAFFGIFTSVLAEESLGVEPIARAVNLDGSSTARAYVFTRKDSGITDVKSMRNKRAVFVDQVTATGYLYALALLSKNGVSDYKSHFSSYTFTGGHESAVYAVLSEQADVGVVKGRILEKMRAKDPLINDSIKIIDESEDLPDNTLYLRSSLPIEVKLKMQQALFHMHEDPEGVRVLEKLGALRFIEATRADFSVVRSMARKANIDIKRFKYEEE